MIDITIISYIMTIIALILSIIAISYIINYKKKLKDIDMISDVINLQNNKIADIAWKIDLLSRSESSFKEIKQYDDMEPSKKNSLIAIKNQINENQANALESAIINNLKNQELSSTEIQALVGKTREHVSRTLKKMVEAGTLERDESHKPYKYRLVSKSNLE